MASFDIVQAQNDLIDAGAYTLLESIMSQDPSKHKTLLEAALYVMKVQLKRLKPASIEDEELSIEVDEEEMDSILNLSTDELVERIKERQDKRKAVRRAKRVGPTTAPLVGMTGDESTEVLRSIMQRLVDSGVKSEVLDDSHPFIWAMLVFRDADIKVDDVESVIINPTKTKNPSWVQVLSSMMTPQAFIIVNERLMQYYNIYEDKVQESVVESFIDRSAESEYSESSDEPGWGSW
jgi:hypothetical protein